MWLDVCTCHIHATDAALASIVLIFALFYTYNSTPVTFHFLDTTKKRKDYNRI